MWNQRKWLPPWGKELKPRGSGTGEDTGDDVCKSGHWPGGGDRAEGPFPTMIQHKLTHHRSGLVCNSQTQKSILSVNLQNSYCFDFFFLSILVFIPLVFRKVETDSECSRRFGWRCEKTAG